jgi:hypothetical protein
MEGSLEKCLILRSVWTTQGRLWYDLALIEKAC